MPLVSREIVITTPSGRCPVALKSYDAETVMLWGDQVREIGRQDHNPPYLYSLPALAYWVRQMSLSPKQRDTVLGYLDDIYFDEVHLKKVRAPEPAPTRRIVEEGEAPIPQPSLSRERAALPVAVAAVEPDEDDGPKRTSTRRAKIFGHATTAILRWMGANGFTYEQARSALSGYGDAAQISDASVKMQMYDGSTGKFKFGGLVTLTPEQAAELNHQGGRVAKPAPKKAKK